MHTHTNTRTSTNGRSLFFFVFHLQKKLYFIFASSALHQFYVSLILQWVPHNNERFKKSVVVLFCVLAHSTPISVQCYLCVRWQQRHPCHSPAAASGYKQKANLYALEARLQCPPLRMFVYESYRRPASSRVSLLCSFVPNDLTWPNSKSMQTFVLQNFLLILDI